MRVALHQAAAAAAARLLGTALLASSLLGTSPAAHAVLPPEASGTWAITETRAGQKCTATLMLAPSRLAQAAEDLNRGAARYQGVCVDSADGSWLTREGEGDAAARLAWRLEYDKSTVFFAFDLPETGELAGKGDVYAAPRSDPKALRKVGVFDARRVSREWQLRDPAVARRVADKLFRVCSPHSRSCTTAGSSRMKNGARAAGSRSTSW